MEFYNKVMLYFWLGTAIVSSLIFTYMGITEGFDRWLAYYVISIIALLMYFARRWMIKRMNKHLKFLEEQRKGKA